MLCSGDKTSLSLSIERDFFFILEFGLMGDKSSISISASKLTLLLEPIDLLNLEDLRVEEDLFTVLKSKLTSSNSPSGLSKTKVLEFLLVFADVILDKLREDFGVVRSLLDEDCEANESSGLSDSLEIDLSSNELFEGRLERDDKLTDSLRSTLSFEVFEFKDLSSSKAFRKESSDGKAIDLLKLKLGSLSPIAN